jgi:phosphoribosylaminoimidazole (AIR) synthetase
MEHVFNMGVGFVLVVSPYYATKIQAMVQELGFRCWSIGRAVSGTGKSRYST